MKGGEQTKWILGNEINNFALTVAVILTASVFNK